MMLKKIIKIIRNIICLVGLICLSPLLIIAGLIIIIEDGFPVFFVQERIGLNKNIFNMIKIRTLRKNTPNIGTHELKESNMLKNGKWIRKLKLDEFPQLINVLKGDINLVGPRPGLLTQEELTQERSQRDIYRIKPGITGLAQILGYDMSDPKKLAEVDKIYVDNSNWILDLKIILATIFPPLRETIKTEFINDI